MLIYFLYIILSPLLWVILFFVSLINIKVGRHWKNQKHTIRNTKQKIMYSCNNLKIVLFHAASTGEFEQIKPIQTGVSLNTRNVFKQLFNKINYVNRIKYYVNFILFHKLQIAF